MSAITLEYIKAEQTKLAEMIALFEAQAATTYLFPETGIDLKPGEHYAGLILGDGMPSHHLILLPGDSEEAEWEKQMGWAKEQGGDLPTRQEQSLLFANCKKHFEEDWYWSGEQPANKDCAWCQDFYDGYHHYGDISSKLRARAVRRSGKFREGLSQRRFAGTAHP